jgi:hypothetical protein
MGHRSCSELQEFAGNKREIERKEKRKNKGKRIFKTTFRNLILFSKQVLKILYV